jgi:hypothetical protein
MLPPSLAVLGLLSGLAVETGSPDALCPDLASTRAAIESRVGELELESAGPWRVRYTMVHAPESASGDYLRLEIRDGIGDLRLERDLSLADDSCSTLAQAIALVVERFFRALVAQGPVEPPMVTSSAPPPPSPAPVLERGVDTAQVERHDLRAAMVLLAIQGGVLGPSYTPTVGPLLVFEARAPFSIALGSSLGLTPSSEELERGGEAHRRNGLLRVTPSWDARFGATRLAVGPTASLAIEQGWTTGIDETSREHRAVMAAGGATSLRFALGPGSAIDLTGLVEAPFLPFGGEFTVDGHEVLVPPALQTSFALAWGVAWFR